MEVDSSINNTKLHFETLPEKTAKALLKLSKVEFIKDSGWYLAGGTALALCVGNRQSVDLDFFTIQKKFDELAVEREMENAGEWKKVYGENGTIYGVFEGAKVSFIAYPFFTPRVEKIKYGNVSILLPQDIAVMKIIAVSQRGRKRDFYDLYWYAKNIEPLGDVVLRVPKQYKNLEHNYHHIIKSLTYFVDAESDPEPKLFFKATWIGIKKFFREEAKNLSKKILF